MKSEGELFYMKTKQTVHAKGGKEINVTAVILYLLIFLIFLAAEGISAAAPRGTVPLFTRLSQKTACVFLDNTNYINYI